MRHLAYVAFILYPSICLPLMHVHGYTSLKKAEPPRTNAAGQGTQISSANLSSDGRRTPPGQTDSNLGPEDSLSSSELSKRCGRNEEYKHCVSGKCSEWKCRYLWHGWPTRCTRDCRQGCFCKHGYFRTHKKGCELGYHCFFESRFYEKNRAE
uniref:Putative similar to chymotrypsin-elastase inhibitor ixodidin n=1 Tax=Rhipicephalus pulchellus TaxID=72859 RepID=L7LSI1_RHIPC